MRSGGAAVVSPLLREAGHGLEKEKKIRGTAVRRGGCSV